MIAGLSNEFGRAMTRTCPQIVRMYSRITFCLSVTSKTGSCLYKNKWSESLALMSRVAGVR
jgi:hypothetical protein